MQETLFSDYGIKIVKRGGIFFIIYDNGEIAVKMEEMEISEEDAKKAMLSAGDAYNVILSYKNKEGSD